MRIQATVILSFLGALSMPGGGSAVGQSAASTAAGDRVSWSERPVVMVLGDEDLTDSRSQREALRLIERAEEEGASVLVVELNLNLPVESAPALQIVDRLSETAIPTMAYVQPSATGAGVIISLACDSIYLGPSGIIGGAGVVVEGKKDDEATEQRAAQQRSILKARARSLARRNGYRLDVVEAMVDGSREVRIGDEVVSSVGEILTLTADEATRLADGLPLLAKGIAENAAAAIQAEGFSGDPVRFTPRQFGESDTRGRLSVSKQQEGRTPSGAESESAAEDAAETDPSAVPESVGPEEEARAPRRPLFGKREQDSYEGKVVVLTIGQDTLATGKASFDFMERTIRKAELDGAAALVFDMDTPGGFAWYTDGLALNSLQGVSYPTFSFVNSRAESAGAIIAVATDHIYMRPAATIGSALVVGGAGQDLAEAMADKVTQMIIGSVRNMAELKGHNPDVAEAFVTRDKEVRIDGVVVHEAGNVLNLNTIRATEVIGGRPVLAKGVANSIEEILAFEGIEAEVVQAEAFGLEAFAHWVQKLSILLIVVGLAGAYMELNSPGFGFPGLVSVLAFSLFFFGNYLAGNLAGYELAVLLTVGLLLLAVEVFVFPGAIIPGAIGGALVLFSLGLAMVDRVDVQWKWEGLPGADTWFSILRSSLFALAAGMAGSLALIAAMMRYLPDSRFGSRLVLKEAVAGGASLGDFGSDGSDAVTDRGASVPKARSVVGQEGVAATDLLPSGKGKFGKRLLDIVSEGQFIARGDRVRVVLHEGSRVVVAKVDE